MTKSRLDGSLVVNPRRESKISPILLKGFSDYASCLTADPSSVGVPLGWLFLAIKNKYSPTINGVVTVFG